MKKSKNFRITQVCGNLSAKDILSKREELEAEENEKKSLLAAKKAKKDEMKKNFLQCKDGCQCEDFSECKAIGLKQCTVCLNILKSQCNKANCKLAAKGKPDMIVITRKLKEGSNMKKAVSAFASARPRGVKFTCSGKQKKSKVYNTIYTDSEDDDEEELEFSTSENDDSSGGEELMNDKDFEAQLIETWKSLSPPVSEDEIKSKWLAAIFRQDEKQIMCIGRVLKRFLEDEGGNVTHIELDCLKPKVGNENVLYGYPKGQSDCYAFPIEDVIGGPLDSVPVPRKMAWRFPNLPKIEEFFDNVKPLARSDIMKKFYNHS